ncbi:hypothetical protein F4859DRAFT_520482 [Xylaria cf. heliscus]|nr:hypothetical protein F4859DRAFT_520482 [Xylaria cf. heliscus]
MFTSSVYYLVRQDEYKKVKPYALRYVPEDGIPQTIIEAERRAVVVRDLRTREREMDLNRDGFILMSFKPDIPREVFCKSGSIRSIYIRELATQMKSFLGARHVEVLDYATRRRFDTATVALDQASLARNLFPMAHIDMTVEEAERTIQAWKPIRGPVKDWPLALCNPSSVNYDEDVVPCDVVFEDHFTENSQIHYSENHEWLYISDQRGDEVLIFTTVDKNFRDGLGPPHAAIPLPEALQGDEPRESIDCRVFVSYADIDVFPRAREDAFTSDSYL